MGSLICFINYSSVYILLVCLVPFWWVMVSGPVSDTLFEVGHGGWLEWLSGLRCASGKLYGLDLGVSIDLSFSTQILTNK